MQAWIGLGGNFADSSKTLQSALGLLNEHPDIRVVRVSSLYRTAPWGVEDQPDFINAVAELNSGLSAQGLLERLLETETALGRKRTGSQWGPRLVDLDLLSYQDDVVKSESLELPHPRMHLRAFVLVPLLELEPEFIIPGIGPAKACLDRLPNSEVRAVKVMGTPEDLEE